LESQNSFSAGTSVRGGVRGRFTSSASNASLIGERKCIPNNFLFLRMFELTGGLACAHFIGHKEGGDNGDEDNDDDDDDNDDYDDDEVGVV
jgi:hypothetical protein